MYAREKINAVTIPPTRTKPRSQRRSTKTVRKRLSQGSPGVVAEIEPTKGVAGLARA